MSFALLQVFIFSFHNEKLNKSAEIKRWNYDYGVMHIVFEPDENANADSEKKNKKINK